MQCFIAYILLPNSINRRDKNKNRHNWHGCKVFRFVFVLITIEIGYVTNITSLVMKIDLLIFILS